MFEISFPLFYLPTPHLDDLSTRGLRFFILFFSCLHDNDVYIPSHLYLRYDREWASTKAYLEKGGGFVFILLALFWDSVVVATETLLAFASH